MCHPTPRHSHHSTHYTCVCQTRQVSLSVRERLRGQKDGHYVVVTGINPTPLGEVYMPVYVCMHVYLYIYSCSSRRLLAYFLGEGGPMSIERPLRFLLHTHVTSKHLNTQGTSTTTIGLCQALGTHT